MTYKDNPHYGLKMAAVAIAYAIHITHVEATFRKLEIRSHIVI